MEIKFKITNINYKNTKTNYYILRGRVLKNTNKILKLKNVTVKGTINKQTISKGDILTIECNYNKTDDCLYFVKLIETEDTLKEEQINFFVQNTNKISKQTISKIFTTYSLEDIERDNSLLDNLKLSENKKQQILECLDKYVQNTQVQFILHSFCKLSLEQCNLIYSLYKQDSVNIIKSNPFTLYFNKVATWTECINIFNTYNLKQEVLEKAIFYKNLFDKCYLEGNTCIRKEEIENKELLEELIKEDKLKEYKDCIYLNKLYWLERKLEQRIKEILDNTINVNTNIVDTEQEDAVQNALHNGLSILTGGPGTGKTYTVNLLVKKLEELGYSYCLLAPTGKAADRMSELTNRETSTIHRKLKIAPYDFLQEETEKLEEQYVIIDECSMLDLELSYYLFNSIDYKKTHIVLVGDVNQIPSVGPGNVFKDLIDSKLIKTTKLTKVYRQSLNSKIVTNSYNLINNKDLDYSKSVDFEFIECKDIEYIQNYIKQNYNSSTQILTTQHESQLGTDVLNLIIQNKEKEGFYIGDKVIQTVNNYDLDVYNGNIGYVIDKKEEVINGELQTLLTVEFNNINKKIEYNNSTIKELKLAYALTIHKSQGSEFDTVILPIFNCLEFMLNKNLLYTAFTRAKKKLILIGDKEVLENTKNKEITRLSNLFK